MNSILTTLLTIILISTPVASTTNNIDNNYSNFANNSYFSKETTLNSLELKENNLLENKFLSISKNELDKIFLKYQNIKKKEVVHQLNNIIKVGLVSLQDEKNNLPIKNYYFIEPSKNIIVVKNNIEHRKAFDKNPNTIFSTVGNVVLDISNLSKADKQIIKEYSEIYKDYLHLENDTLILYVNQTIEK